MKLPFACPVPRLPAAQGAAPYVEVSYAASAPWAADANVIQAVLMTHPSLRVPSAYIEASLNSNILLQTRKIQNSCAQIRILLSQWICMDL